MAAPALSVLASGMVSGVGLSAPASCAAIRAAIDNFQETRFMDNGGEWIVASEVLLEQPWRGLTKQAKMLAMAISECLEQLPGVKPEQIPLLLCVAETKRPGRLQGLDAELFKQLQDELRHSFDTEHSTIIAHGRVAGAVALLQARRLLVEKRVPVVLVAGVDSFLIGSTLADFEERDRLQTSINSNGFIPGEGAAAILVSLPLRHEEPQLLCRGLGFAVEAATIESELPLRGEGLSQAIKAALTEANCAMHDLDYRITDIAGEQYYFKEASLALSRTLRQRKEEFDIWHPADCIGEVGAAIGPVMLTVLLAACRKGYTLSNHILCHCGSDDGKRAALVLSYQPVGRQ